MSPRDVTLPEPEPSPVRRSFLFLQGPISPFFAEVAAGLHARGHAVHRINLNLGDKLFWRGAPGVAEDFTGRVEAWPGFVADAMDRWAVTDLVLLGEQRECHRVAIAAARERGVAVTVTDFGYFRPDWITLERDGMGGDSRFPREPEAIRALAAGLPPADLTERYKDDFRRQAVWDVLYHLANMLPWPFPHYRSHHLHHPLATYAGIGWRLLRRGAERAEGARVLAHVQGKPYWVFAMQMETDFSIRAYSDYPDMDTPLREVVRSFAQHAPRDGQLIVKVHPLDPCLKRWGRRIPAIAAAAGVTERVHVAHHGTLDAMIAGSRAVVTVNSTVGLRAIVMERPAKALGRAVWDVPGLAHQGALDAFWAEAAAPDAALRADFLAALQATTQVRGVFYGEAGRRVGVAEAVAWCEALRPDAAAVTPGATGFDAA
ncbi:capsule biosynthesis protein [Falsiroseomonas oryziterrae]|uniref:capsule biosynthesis protein n=1 Tax=Falsiroseomonas oryziterrae TaxID=2911368 RepID=UPI001F26EF13|nr:capsular biosynthesis protein [Roseomonas sp. NPKOSM-4]